MDSRIKLLAPKKRTILDTDNHMDILECSQSPNSIHQAISQNGDLGIVAGPRRYQYTLAPALRLLLVVAAISCQDR